MSEDILTEIRERLVRVETKIDTMSDIQHTVNQAEKVANEAMISTRSAHKRIDKIDKAMFWVVTTVLGAVVIGVLSLLFTGGS